MPAFPQRACSISTSYASFEAELEGSILQHTGAVDYYLETQAPKWTSSSDDHATQQRLHSLFIGDMNTSFWQAFTHSRVSNAALCTPSCTGATEQVSSRNPICLSGAWHADPRVRHTARRGSISSWKSRHMHSTCASSCLQFASSLSYAARHSCVCTNIPVVTAAGSQLML
jgi:hypothetical protein